MVVTYGMQHKQSVSQIPTFECNWCIHLKDIYYPQSTASYFRTMKIRYHATQSSYLKRL